MRILLDSMSAMLRGFITDILSSDPQCEIVAESQGQNSLHDKLNETHADVVILAHTDNSDALDQFSALLAQYPATKIIAIAAGGNRALLYDLRPHVTYINKLSPEQLLSTIKKTPAFSRHEA
jgi:chemotaxis response regulator CheB